MKEMGHEVSPEDMPSPDIKYKDGSQYDKISKQKK